MYIYILYIIGTIIFLTPDQLPRARYRVDGMSYYFFFTVSKHTHIVTVSVFVCV